MRVALAALHDPPTDPGCWQGQLPPEAQPTPALLSVADACQIRGESGHAMDLPGDQLVRRRFDGQIAGALGGLRRLGRRLRSARGYRFRCPRRWSLLTTAAGGGLVSMDAAVDGSRGYYYLSARDSSTSTAKVRHPEGQSPSSPSHRAAGTSCGSSTTMRGARPARCTRARRRHLSMATTICRRSPTDAAPWLAPGMCRGIP